MTKTRYILIALIIVLWGVGYIVAHKDQGPDAQQVTATVYRGRDAIQEKDLSKAMSCVSPAYHDGADYDFDRIRMLGVELFRAEAKYEVKMDQPKVKINGDRADVVTNITINYGHGDTTAMIPSRELTLHLRKEPTRKFLIYHVPEWKITAIDGIPNAGDSGV
jgi:hypothetical protein